MVTARSEAKDDETQDDAEPEESASEGEASSEAKTSADEQAREGGDSSAEAGHGSAAPRKKKKKKARRRREEPVPVVSGRFWIAVAMLAATAFLPYSPLGNLFEPEGPPQSVLTEWKPGNTSVVRITLVTADYNLLSCASEQVLEGQQCGYKTETERFPNDPKRPLDDNNENVIQPYRTWPDNQLILVSGLWAEPALATRLHREPPGGVASNKLARFVTECRMKFLGYLEKPKLRWAPGQSWQPEKGNVIVAKPESCKIVDDDVLGS
jgi:hypothetical protein